MRTLPIDLSRESLHGIETRSAFAVDGPFTVELINHGEAVHVHLHLDDPLSQVASIGTNNHFLPAGAEKQLTIDVTPKVHEVSGQLKIVSGHGADATYVNLTVEANETAGDRIPVDERLSKPKPKPKQTGRSTPDVGISERLGGISPVLLGFAVVAVALALWLALSIGGAVVLVGAIVVLAGVLGAIVLATTW